MGAIKGIWMRIDGLEIKIKELSFVLQFVCCVSSLAKFHREYLPFYYTKICIPI